MIRRLFGPGRAGTPGFRRAPIDPSAHRSGAARPEPAAPERIAGVDLQGDTVEHRVDDRRIVILFVSSGCKTCRSLWGHLGRSPGLLVVTPSPATESPRTVQRLSAGAATVVMSSEAWFDFGVRQAPTLVVVERGLIASRLECPGPLAVARALGTCAGGASSLDMF